MLILILSYFGGMLTIVSPCVLPVVPFIFSRSDEPFRKSGFPMLLGMGLSFAAFASLSVVGARWVIQINQIGRAIALVVFALVGLSLIFSSFAERLARPFVRLGAVLKTKADARSGMVKPLLLGASVGLLWAPCAGPILGLVLAGAAINGSKQKTFGLLLVFALGAATSLGIAIFAGGKVLGALKKGLGFEEWIKRGLGVMVLGAVVAIALGLDTQLLSKFSYFNTNKLEQRLVDQVLPTAEPVQENAAILADEGPVPSLEGATSWLNSEPLTAASLRGKVVLIDFWTYSCINCLRTLPYLKTWSEKYRAQGLIIVGVHTPEFAFEKDAANVERAVRDLKVTYPVALDNNRTIWSAFGNHYWPAHYFVDVKGRVRHHHFGEGDYEESEQLIQKLLKEIPRNVPLGSKELSGATSPLATATGVEAFSDGEDVESPETYLGYRRQKGWNSYQAIKKDRVQIYSEPAHLDLNQWAVSGGWEIGAEKAKLRSSRGSLTFKFKARDLHLVLGSSTEKSIAYHVTLDGHPPGMDHGADTDSAGNGELHDHRLYQLIRQKTNETEHTFRIEFISTGVEIFAFTFG